MATTNYTVHLSADDEIEVGSVYAIGDHWDFIRLAGATTLWLGATQEDVAENALRLIEAAQKVRENALRRLLVAEPADPIDAAKATREIAEAGVPVTVTVTPRGQRIIDQQFDEAEA